MKKYLVVNKMDNNVLGELIMPDTNIMIKISVIIAMKNARKYIGRAVDSVLAQSLEEIELIIVDDNSTDGSGEFVNEYYGCIENIHLFYNKGVTGPGVCRNIGLKHARGQYIAFIDSDDFIEEKFFLTLYDIAVKSGAEIAVCGFEKVSDDGYLRSYVPEKGVFAGGPALIEYINKIEFVVWNKLYRRSFLEKNNIKFLLPCYGEDWLFCLTAMFYAEKYVCTDETLYYYYQHYDSICHKCITVEDFSHIYEFFICLDKFIKIQHNLTKEMSQEIESNFFFGILTCYVVPFYKKAKPEEQKLLRGKIAAEYFGKGTPIVGIMLDAVIKLFNCVVNDIRK